MPDRKLSPVVPPSGRVPSYRRHRPSGQAVVTLNGHDRYLGKWNTAASKREYHRLLAEWVAVGGCLPDPHASDLHVAEVALAYLRFAEGYYRRDGQPTGHEQAVKQAVRLVRESYGHRLVSEFGPLALRAIQERLAQAGRTRTYANQLVGIIRRMFRWAASQEMIPVAIYQALATDPGLRKDRSKAREPEPVPPVADAVVDATLPHLPPVIRAMVEFQRLVGCRPAGPGNVGTHDTREIQSRSGSDTR